MYGTTEIYTHLDASDKIGSANKISAMLSEQAS